MAAGRIRADDARGIPRLERIDLIAATLGDSVRIRLTRNSLLTYD